MYPPKCLKSLVFGKFHQGWQARSNLPEIPFHGNCDHHAEYLGGDYFWLADDTAGTLTCHFPERGFPP